MPKRPRSHILEDLARVKLREAFASAGWTTEDLKSDYGEDLLVRIFDEGVATPWSFFVQSKATDHIDRYLVDSGGIVSYPIHSVHITHWQAFWEPVVLTVFDAASGRTHWTIIQDSLDAHAAITPVPISLSIRVPRSSVLDQEGLIRLRYRTKERFARFEREREGAEHLLTALKEHLGLTIEYDPQYGSLFLPIGRFVPDEEGGRKVVLFGKAAAHIVALQEMTSANPETLVLSAIKMYGDIINGFREGFKLNVVRNDTSEIIKSFDSAEELFAHILCKQELEE